PVTVTLHDLIPLLYAKDYLEPDPLFSSYYRQKLAYLTQTAGLLAISESSKAEACTHLDIDATRIWNTSEAVGDDFRQIDIAAQDEAKLREKYGIDRQFVLYTGGGDERKNLPRLVRAY